MALLIIPFMLRKNMEYRVVLNKDQIEFLSKLPEQGMLYQLVYITLKDGRVLKNKVVINSTYLKLDESEYVKADDIARIDLHKADN
jgi:hypothetical protein